MIAIGMVVGVWLVYEPGALDFEDRARLLLLMPAVCVGAMMLVTGRTSRVARDPMQAHMSEEAIQAELGRYPPVVRAALLALREQSQGRADIRPPLHRLLWRAGVPAPPFDFGHFGWNLAVLGTAMFFAAPFWIYLYAIVERVTAVEPDVHMALVSAHVITFVLAVIALAMSAYMRSEARRTGLPTWREFKARFRERPGEQPGYDRAD